MQDPSSRQQPLLAAVTVFSLVTFAGLPGRGLMALGAVGLAGCAVFLILYREREPLKLAGLTAGPGNRLPWLAAGGLAGVVLGLFYRAVYPVPLFPPTLTLTAIISPLIGMTEEVIFRGVVQGSLKKLRPPAAIVLAAAGHSLYKTVLLASVPLGGEVDLLKLSLYTFGVGIILGAFRHFSGNIYPAVVSHGIFDIMVYGDEISLPAWVWY